MLTAAHYRRTGQDAPEDVSRGQHQIVTDRRLGFGLGISRIDYTDKTDFAGAAGIPGCPFIAARSGSADAFDGTVPAFT